MRDGKSTVRLPTTGVVGAARRLLPLFGAMALLSLIAAAPARADKRVALVIGNSAYRNVPQLDNPKNDARLMAETLRGLGFALIGDAAQIDLDKAGFDDVLQKFGNLLIGADVALFYYAGHGVQLRGNNYLVPVNANPAREADVLFQMVDTSLVLAAMEGSGTKLNLVILDACRNNPFGGRGLRATGGGLAQMQAPEGTLISYATQPGNVALDGAGGNSPYTKALAATIRRAGLDVFQTFNDVGLAVQQATRGAQQPWVSSSPIAGSFYFAGPPAGGQTTAPPPAVVATASEEAARAWSVIQNTTSVAVIEDFIRQFGNTAYGSMARARLDEIKKSHVAVVAPPAPPATRASPVQQAVAAPGDRASEASLSGRWRWFANCGSAGRYHGEFQISQTSDGSFTGAFTSDMTEAGTAVSPVPQPVRNGRAGGGQVSFARDVGGGTQQWSGTIPQAPGRTRSMAGSLTLAGGMGACTWTATR
jgi:hypothetical protein